MTATLAIGVVGETAHVKGPVHYVNVCDNCPPTNTALCGVRLHGARADNEEVECVVCEDLGRDGYFCTSCGAWLYD